MPKVARIVVSGSRPSRGRSVVTWMTAPSSAIVYRGHDEREPEVAGRHHRRRAYVGAEHEQLAVGEVHDVHDPEDERQPRGDQRQDHAADDAVDDLDQEQIEGNGHGQTPRY